METKTEERPSNDAIAVTLRPVRPDDEAFLFNLYATTRLDDLAVGNWDEAQREAILKMQFMAQQQAYPVEYPQADHQIILLDGRPIGRVIVERTDQEHRGVDIALLPEYRGAGIGGALIRDLLDEATKAGKPFRISVEKINRAARLYERLGFRTTGDTSSHLLMEWRLSL